MCNIDEEKVINKMNETGLEYINIYGLFDRYDVELPFEKEVNIYIGENGLGKTTILNCIYYLLEKKFLKLSQINFNTIHIKFTNEDEPHIISNSDLTMYNKRRSPINGRMREDSYFNHVLEELLLDITAENGLSDFDYNNELEIETLSRKVARMLDVPVSYARNRLLEYISINIKHGNSSKGNPDKIKKLVLSINQNIKQKIIYLPTYRRIEDDFANLNINPEKFHNNELLIKFGMADVQAAIDEILNSIRYVAMDGFNKMTGVLLKQFAASSNINIISQKLYDTETVKIVLDRMGNVIEPEYKDKIINLISTKDIYKDEYIYLLNLIDKLISNYQVQKKYDDRIKNFSNTCNKYLNGKKFYYNQSELSLKIHLLSEGVLSSHTIELTQLSSGEKQIVSLFSKLYLENETNSIVIIDEPELSLSIKWQSMLLPDIMRSNNCKLLLTVTHSPFIFENEFDFDSKEMRKYIKNTKEHK